MRTNDGGAHWVDVSPPSIPSRANKNDEFFLDATHAWVAETASSPTKCVDHVVTFRTVDGGRSWQQAAPLPVRYGAPTDVIWTGEGNHAGWFSFVDADHGWLLLGSGPAVSAQGQDPSWVGAGWRLGDLYRTTDGGLHWTLVARDPGSGTRCQPAPLVATLLETKISFASATNGWIWNIDLCGLLVTHDGGVTWSRSSLPAAPLEAPVFFDPRNGLVNADLVMLVTSDGGVSWSVRPMPGAAAFVDFSNPTDGWTAVLANNAAIQCNADNTASCNADFRLYHTVDGGRTWQPGNHTSLTLPGMKWWPPSYLHFVDSKIGFADPGEKGLFRTTDAGLTWTRVAGSIEGR